MELLDELKASIEHQHDYRNDEHHEGHPYCNPIGIDDGGKTPINGSGRVVPEDTEYYKTINEYVMNAAAASASTNAHHLTRGRLNSTSFNRVISQPLRERQAQSLAVHGGDTRRKLCLGTFQPPATWR